MAIENLPEEETLAFLKEAPESDSPRMEPETCRHCGAILTPEVDRGRILYFCPMCEED